MFVYVNHTQKRSWNQPVLRILTRILYH